MRDDRLRPPVRAPESGNEHEPASPPPEAPRDECPVTTHAPSPLPRSIGHFRILRQIGEGGMGVVYEAEQQHPKRAVALKVIRGGGYVDEHRVRLFQREAQTLARLKHPSIAAIYESGHTDDGHHFFAMELVRGETLDAFAKRRPAADLTPSERRERLELFRKICDGVSYAHQRGVIHRDLKPSNILVLRETVPGASGTSQPSAPEIKILDFGLARITDSDVAVSTVVTDLGQVQGTIPYMSPEQVRGNPDEIDLRTDVYSLGVLLYELLSGRRPYDVKQSLLPEAIRVICEESPRPLSKIWKGKQRLDPDVITIVLKALEKEPSRRYQSAAAFAEDVQRYLTQQPILARPPTAAYQLRKLAARHKTPFAFVAVLFVLLVGFGVTMTLQARRIALARDRASQEAATAQSVSKFLVDLFKVSDPSEAKGNSITARELLDKGSERIGRELADQPLVQAKLMRTIAEVYLSLGLRARAEPLIEQALAIQERLLGEKNIEVAEDFDLLGDNLSVLGRPQEGIADHRRALAIKQGILAPDDPRTGASLYGLATALSRWGDHAEAVQDFERAQAIFEKSSDNDSRLKLSWCLNDLGLMKLAARDYVGAKPLLERALEIKESVLPGDHPDVSNGQTNLGYLRMRVGDYGEARRLLERSLAILERDLGPEHASTAEILVSLGEMWWRSGDPRKALPLLERGVSFEEQTSWGADLTSLYVLAASRREVGDYGGAEVLFKRALALHARALADGIGVLRSMPFDTSIKLSNPDVAECLREYAKLLRQTKRDREALDMEARAKEILAKGGGTSQ